MAISPQLTQRIEELQTQHSVIFQTAFEQAEKMLAPVYMTIPSATSYGDYSWMAQLPSMRKWIGDAVVNGLAARSYTLKNEKYEFTYKVDIDALNDNTSTLGTFSMHPALAGEAAGRLEEEEFSKVLLSNSLTCFDGKKFFAADHPVNVDDASFGTYSNLFASKPLTPANFEAGFQAFRQQKGDNGVVLATRATHLVVGPELEYAARRLIEMKLVAEGGAGVENPNYGRVQVIVAPFLGNSTDWFLMDLSRPLKPFFWQAREENGLVMSDPNSDHMLLKREILFQVFRRGAPGCSLPFLAHKFTA